MPRRRPRASECDGRCGVLKRVLLWSPARGPRHDRAGKRTMDPRRYFHDRAPRPSLCCPLSERVVDHVIDDSERRRGPRARRRLRKARMAACAIIAGATRPAAVGRGHEPGVPREARVTRPRACPRNRLSIPPRRMADYPRRRSRSTRAVRGFDARVGGSRQRAARPAPAGAAGADASSWGNALENPPTPEYLECWARRPATTGATRQHRRDRGRALARSEPSRASLAAGTRTRTSTRSRSSGYVTRPARHDADAMRERVLRWRDAYLAGPRYARVRALFPMRKRQVRRRCRNAPTGAAGTVPTRRPLPGHVAGESAPQATDRPYLAITTLHMSAGRAVTMFTEIDALRMRPAGLVRAVPVRRCGLRADRTPSSSTGSAGLQIDTMTRTPARAGSEYSMRVDRVNGVRPHARAKRDDGAPPSWSARRRPVGQPLTSPRLRHLRQLALVEFSSSVASPASRAPSCRASALNGMCRAPT